MHTLPGIRLGPPAKRELLVVLALVFCYGFFEGHYYSDKARGSALVGVPLYAALTLVYRAAGAGTPDPAAAIEALAFAESGLATASLVALIFDEAFYVNAARVMIGIAPRPAETCTTPDRASW